MQKQQSRDVLKNNKFTGENSCRIFSGKFVVLIRGEGGGYGFVKTDKCGRPRTQKARFKYTSFLSLISFLSYGSLQNLLQMLCSLEAI